MPLMVSGLNRWVKVVMGRRPIAPCALGGRQNRNCEGALPFLAGDASLHRRYSVSKLLRRRAHGECLDTFDLTVSSFCTSTLSGLRVTQRTAFSEVGPIDRRVADADSVPRIRGPDSQRFGTKVRPHAIELIQAIGRNSEDELELTVAARHEREGRLPSGRAQSFDLSVQQAGECCFHAN